jgi:hypothetical protein
MVDLRWTLGQVKAQQHYLWRSCPKVMCMQMLDIDQLITHLGADFDIIGDRLSKIMPCPCGTLGHEPNIGVGEMVQIDLKAQWVGQPSGAHARGPATLFEEDFR